MGWLPPMHRGIPDGLCIAMLRGTRTSRTLPLTLHGKRATRRYSTPTPPPWPPQVQRLHAYATPRLRHPATPLATSGSMSAAQGAGAAGRPTPLPACCTTVAGCVCRTSGGEQAVAGGIASVAGLLQACCRLVAGLLQACSGCTLGQCFRAV